MSQDFEELLGWLNARKVRYLGVDAHVGSLPPTAGPAMAGLVASTLQDARDAHLLTPTYAVKRHRKPLGEHVDSSHHRLKPAEAGPGHRPPLGRGADGWHNSAQERWAWMMLSRCHAPDACPGSDCDEPRPGVRFVTL